MTAVNLNRAIRGPVTAVPVVAGKGVRIVPDTVNNRFVVEADETVLYENGSSSSATLSETSDNFEKLEVWVYTNAFNTIRCPVSIPSGKKGTANFIGGSGSNMYHFYACTISVSGTTVSTENGCHRWFAISGGTGVGTEGEALCIEKVIGINRISST